MERVRPQRWSWRSSQKGRSPRPSARHGARTGTDWHGHGRARAASSDSLPQALVRVAHDAGSMDNITVMVVAF